VHARAAIAAGVKLSINTDAHSTGGLGAMIFGIEVARRAWAGSVDVINCLGVSELKSLVRRKRPR